MRMGALLPLESGRDVIACPKKRVSASLDEFTTNFSGSVANSADRCSWAEAGPTPKKGSHSTGCRQDEENSPGKSRQRSSFGGGEADVCTIAFGRVHCCPTVGQI